MSNPVFPILDAKATGARIKELRVKKHLKVEDVSRFMGFESEQAVYKWQRGDSLPTIDNLYALSVLFETSVDDILMGSKEESVSSPSPVYGIICSYISIIRYIASKAIVCNNIFAAR